MRCRRSSSSSSQLVRSVKQSAPGVAHRSISVQAGEDRAHVLDEQIWCLHRREVSAAIELGPANDRVGWFGEAADGDVGGKDGDRSRNALGPLGRPDRRIAEPIVVRGRRGPGQARSSTPSKEDAHRKRTTRPQTPSPPPGRYAHRAHRRPAADTRRDRVPAVAVPVKDDTPAGAAVKC
jgi:hypothetical protein